MYAKTKKISTDIPVNVKTSLTALLACSTLMLTACGDRDTSGDSVVLQGEPADTVTNESLQRNAADASGKSLGTNFLSIVQTMNGSTAIGSAFTIPGLGLTESTSPDGVFNDPTEPGPLINADFETRVRDESGSIFETSLGLSGNATTTRSGNVLTVNPDEAEMCLQQGELVGASYCEQLMVDLTVQIDAATDQAGTISYLFQGQPVAVVDYAPNAGSYELKLAGLHSVLVRVNELDATADAAPEIMTGSVKFEAIVTNATVGAEAGTIKISIPETVEILDDATAADVFIAPSTLLAVSSDSATGAASVEVGIGALSMTTKSDELSGNPLQRLALTGLTARADLTQNGDVLTMSNVSLGNGPLTISVDSLEVMQATLDNFGFTINNSANSIVLDDSMYFSLVMSNALGFLDANQSNDWTSELTVSANSGTAFSEIASGVMRLDQGGPLNLSYLLFDGSMSENGSVSVQPGECFGDALESELPVDVVGC